MRKKQPQLFQEILVPSKPGTGRLFDVSYEETEQGPVICLGMTFENDEARRAHFTEELRKKLQDPEFRKIEGFPIGDDENILALSDPPYYTACPNPFLRDVLLQHRLSYFTADDSYNCEPYAADITEGKHDPIYKAHTYHTKVPPQAILKFIDHYTNPQDVVLDPYAGSGMTGVAGRLLGNRTIIQCDLAPAATHIAAGYAYPWDMAHFHSRATEILNTATETFKERFQAIESGKRVGTLKYCVWSDVLLCDSCGEPYTFAEAAVDLKNKTILNNYNCPHCGSNQSKSSANYARETVFDPYLKKTISWNKRLPFWIVYENNGKRIKRQMNDAEILDAISIPKNAEASHFSIVPFMFRDERWGCLYRAGYHYGMTHSHHFYNWRILSLLDNIWAMIAESSPSLRPMLRYWFLATAMKCSRLMSYNADGIRRVMKGNLYISSLTQEVNPIHFLEITLRDICAALKQLTCRNSVFTSTGSASDLPIPDNTVDYVFVDPPFGDNLIYSELNFLWECWMHVFTNEKSETIVNNAFGKTLASYTEGMTKGFHEMFRVLKPGRWLTVEFHNSKNSVWTALQESLQKSGFVIADVRVLDKKHGSIKQVQTMGAVKQDLIISAYKPTGELETMFQLEAGTEDGVWDFIRTHLKQLPVFVAKNGQAEVLAERQNYLLFDRMVAFHVRRGVTVPLSASEFYAGLDQRFSSRDGMYFAQDQSVEYDKKRMTVKEMLQLQLFVSDESSAIQWLTQQLTKKPQTFQEIHPQFLREIGAWQKHEKPLELSEILEQNFLCYEINGTIPKQIISWMRQSAEFKEIIDGQLTSGTAKEDENGLSTQDMRLIARAKSRWFVPDPYKVNDLEKLREKALLKEFMEYKDVKRKLKIFRLEAVRTGFKKAWQERDYAIIVAVADKIPNNILEEDPKLLMWYHQAITRMGGE